MRGAWLKARAPGSIVPLAWAQPAPVAARDLRRGGPGIPASGWGPSPSSPIYAIDATACEGRGRGGRRSCRPASALAALGGRGGQAEQKKTQEANTRPSHTQPAGSWGP